MGQEATHERSLIVFECTPHRSIPQPRYCVPLFTTVLPPLLPAAGVGVHCFRRLEDNGSEALEAGVFAGLSSLREL